MCIGQWEVWFWNCDLWWVAVQDRAFIGAAVGGDYCADAVKISDERVAGKISGHVGTGYWIHWRRFCRAVTLTHPDSPAVVFEQHD